jgi:hypothetical protein
MSATADKENERRVVYAKPLQKRHLAFDPTDFFALLKAAENFQTRFAQAVKIPLSAPFPVLNCQSSAEERTNANGKNFNLTLKGPIKD